MKPEEIKSRNKARLAEKREKLLANKELGKPIAELSSQINKTNAQIDSLIQALPEVPTSIDVNNLEEIRVWLDNVVTAVNSIELNPTIKVAAPKVTVPKLDLQPLIDAMSEKETEVSIELEDFRAQDINNEEIGVQYIGFVHPSGAWYIIKNEIEENRMRYKFGKSDYEKSFAAPDTYEYTTLDRAIYEIQT